MANLEGLEELFIKELRDMLDAEKQITKALPKMAKAADSDELRTAFEKHLKQTEGQIQRLEQVFELLEMKPKTEKCVGMRGLIEEGSELMKQDAEPAVLDAGLIASAQKVEHYEIAAYGTLATYAKRLNMREAARLLAENLREEKDTDEKLTKLAETWVNREAAANGGRAGRSAARR